MSGAIRRDKTGMMVSMDDGSLWVVAKTHAALTAYVPYLIDYSTESITIEGTATVNFVAVTKALAAEASIQKLVGVPQKAYASGDIAWLQIGGECKCLALGTTDIAAGDFLKAIPGTTTTALIKEGTALTNSSVAVALEAHTTDATETAIKVGLIGMPRVVNT